MTERGYLPTDGEKAVALFGAFIQQPHDSALRQAALANVMDGATNDDRIWLMVSLANLGGLAIVRAAEAENVEPAEILRQFRVTESE